VVEVKKLIPLLFIAMGASLWGLIAIFVRNLSDAGFTPMEIVTIRVVTATLILFLGGVIKFKNQMKIKLTDLKLFIGTGICSIVFFNWCYFTTINQMNLSIAVILLYTAPAFVTILSFLFLKEGLNWIKIISVIGTLIGCIFIAGFNFKETSIGTIGLLIGLGAGFGYSLYSIFGKVALRRYDSFTVTFYTFLIASIVMVPITGLWDKWSLLVRPDILFWGVGLGLIPTVIAYFLYTWGLSHTESSKAAIIATIEPVVATLLGILYYDESLGMQQLLGSAFILTSVLLVNLPMNSKILISKSKAPNQ
jgi:drug/metabolite transporter, DME family